MYTTSNSLCLPHKTISTHLQDSHIAPIWSPLAIKLSKYDTESRRHSITHTQTTLVQCIIFYVPVFLLSFFVFCSLSFSVMIKPTPDRETTSVIAPGEESLNMLTLGGILSVYGCTCYTPNSSKAGHKYYQDRKHDRWKR